MKIAIITFSDFNTNYGSMLQALSLKIFLEENGHIVEFIRYREFNDDEPYTDLKSAIIDQSKKTIKKIIAFMKKRDAKRKMQNFEAFRNKYFQHTPLYASEDELKDLPPYDCYICGSDQIWNIECLGGIRKPYFLSFAPDDRKKIAYAASMGNYIIPEDEKDIFRQLLEKLDYISLREQESVPQIQALTSKNVCDVIDPVFLTPKEDWGKFMRPVGISGEYAVCYFVRRSKFGKKLVRLLSREYDIPIINLSDNLIYIRGTESKYISSGPLEFISLVSRARYTVGTSFHLAAFSMIFEVPFLIAGMDSNRNRIQNLLRLAGLESNFVTEADDYFAAVKKLFNQSPCREKVDKKIAFSKKYLLEAIQE